MMQHILTALGGIGLFLFGMTVLTEGLRALAGGALRAILARYTTNPVSGAVTGALTTAVIQSSSATTVTAVGFVGAGLITFSQALGVIFGANIGTTITGWLVALIGFKLQLGLMVMPLLLVGVLMRLFGKPKFRHAGTALAGFSLLFIGIETLQHGMAAFEGIVTPDSFPADTLLGRLQLVLIGVGITLVTQSSSAGVATALVALSSGAISFPQAAAMVIGMDVGTTFTAALATVGGSTAMRQTGFAHVIYNVMTGVMAFFLVGIYTNFMDAWVAGGAAGNAQMAVVGFHTMFNILGVILILPFTGAFARFITRLVPEQVPALERGLDRHLLKEPGVAMATALEVARRLGQEAFAILHSQLRPETRQASQEARLEALLRATENTQLYVEEISSSALDPVSADQQVAALHALDHIRRLHHRCTQITRVGALSADRRLARYTAVLAHAVGRFTLDGDISAGRAAFERLHGFMRVQRHRYRQSEVHSSIKEHGPDTTLMARLDAMRWLQRVAYHVWRISYHLGERDQQAEPSASDQED
ncbi:Na/Pi cotransporter family protein [Kordiimonas lacus]|nr:Na/Pi symporter [Kordiimonas lacus]